MNIEIADRYWELAIGYFRIRLEFIAHHKLK
nr:MAG TPA: hypothetical protein [Bacteriophage sp.]